MTPKAPQSSKKAVPDESSSRTAQCRGTTLVRPRLAAEASAGTSIPWRCNGRARRGLCGKITRSRPAAPRPCSAVRSAPVPTSRALCCVVRRLLFSSLPLPKIELHLVYVKILRPSRGNLYLSGWRGGALALSVSLRLTAPPKGGAKKICCGS